MKKRKIGFDLDDVLLDFNHNFCIFNNTELGTNKKREDLYSFDLTKSWGWPLEFVQQRVEQFFLHPLHLHAGTINGSKEVINELAQKKYDLYIVTAKSEELASATLNWVDINFPNCFKKVIFTNQFSGKGKKVLKSEVAKELSLDLFVEDAVHNAFDISSVGIPVLLLDSPWNRSDEVKDPIKRVHSWSEIKNHILSL